MHKAIDFIFRIITVVFVSLAVILPMRFFVIQPFFVNGASMEPSFHDQEYLLVDEITYRLKEPTRGDIIVFRYPLDPREHYIKRLIGMPGETVEIKNNRVIIYNNEYPDGFALEESYLPEGSITQSIGQSVYLLEEGEFFVLGDNREYSKDSRSFGPVDYSYITGRVIFRGWPLDKISVFETPDYMQS